MTHKVDNITNIYMKAISKLHGVPNAMVLDRDPKFPSNFLKGLFKGFETNFNFSTTYHQETDGKIERTNWIIEDMLRMYEMGKLPSGNTTSI